MRIHLLFELILSYPDSIPALTDIRECLKISNQFPLLSEVLISCFSEKLLHLGVSTQDIITAYMSAMSALTVIDPSGFAAEKLCAPIKVYLRGRPDTLLCLANNLCEGDAADLLSRCAPSPEETYTLSWTPEPVCPQPQRIEMKKGDSFGALILLFGSPQQFIDEYFNKVSSRLLSLQTLSHFDKKTEIHLVDLLKRRFGENNLTKCDVMLHDMEQSIQCSTDFNGRSVCDSTHKEVMGEGAKVPMEAMILSRIFWPTLPKAKRMNVHPNIAQHMTDFELEYKKQHHRQHLQWIHNVGCVNLELSHNGLHQSISVSPMLANTLMHLSDHSPISVDDLSKCCGMSTEDIEEHLTYWTNQHIIYQPSPGIYAIAPAETTTKL
ncbi:anaphase-promoting complex subunit 2 [Pelomyxa schiedti]|nr:anaphase-promoting complex subunit 2 [Pelomyxa schiedti]